LGISVNHDHAGIAILHAHRLLDHRGHIGTCCCVLLCASMPVPAVFHARPLPDHRGHIDTRCFVLLCAIAFTVTLSYHSTAATPAHTLLDHQGQCCCVMLCAATLSHHITDFAVCYCYRIIITLQPAATRAYPLDHQGHIDTSCCVMLCAAILSHHITDF
jgi:creatinine amidohydrolase/Fe(II)-dependent formamide hydrolase-like protein